MTEASEQPRWEFLPHDPKGFFGLPSEFQRVDLKRCYNRLIRRFKPEKYPAEFQRIRAAYEQLDTVLRYGADASTTGSLFPAARRGRSGEASGPSRHPGVVSRAKVLEQLKSIAPEIVYAELKSKESKSPPDYFALSILSDLCEPKEQVMFLKWLVNGLQDYPEEPALFQLLHNYFQSELPVRLVVKVLPKLSKIVKNDGFFPLTESLWLELLQQLPFPRFQQLLERCDQDLSGHQIKGKTIFCLQLLRAAAFRAPIEWLDGISSFVEENHEQVPEYLEFEFEITMAILEYRRQAKAFSRGNPTRAAIHAAIVSYCGNDEVAASRAVMDCHSRLSHQATALLEAFPIDDPRDWSPAIEAWRWISVDVARRLWMERRGIDGDELVSVVAENLQQAESGEKRMFWWRIDYGKFGLHALVICSLLFFPKWLIGSFVEMTPVWSTICFSIALIGGILYGVFFFRWLSNHADAKQKRLLEQRYSTRWRPLMMRMLSGTNGNVDECSHVLNYYVEQTEVNCRVAPYLVDFLARDYGLQIFSDAQLFLN